MTIQGPDVPGGRIPENTPPLTEATTDAPPPSVVEGATPSPAVEKASFISLEGIDLSEKPKTEAFTKTLNRMLQEMVTIKDLKENLNKKLENLFPSYANETMVRDRELAEVNSLWEEVCKPDNIKKIFENPQLAWNLRITLEVAKATNALYHTTEDGPRPELTSRQGALEVEKKNLQALIASIEESAPVRKKTGPPIRIYRKKPGSAKRKEKFPAKDIKSPKMAQKAISTLTSERQQSTEKIIRKMKEEGHAILHPLSRKITLAEGNVAVMAQAASEGYEAAAGEDQALASQVLTNAGQAFAKEGLFPAKTGKLGDEFRRELLKNILEIAGPSPTEIASPEPVEEVASSEQEEGSKMEAHTFKIHPVVGEAGTTIGFKKYDDEIEAKVEGWESLMQGFEDTPPSDLQAIATFLGGPHSMDSEALTVSEADDRDRGLIAIGFIPNVAELKDLVLQSAGIQNIKPESLNGPMGKMAGDLSKACKVEGPTDLEKWGIWSFIDATSVENAADEILNTMAMDANFTNFLLVPMASLKAPYELKMIDNDKMLPGKWRAPQNLPPMLGTALLDKPMTRLDLAGPSTNEKIRKIKEAGFDLNDCQENQLHAVDCLKQAAVKMGKSRNDMLTMALGKTQLGTDETVQRFENIYASYGEEKIDPAFKERLHAEVGLDAKTVTAYKKMPTLAAEIRRMEEQDLPKRKADLEALKGKFEAINRKIASQQEKLTDEDLQRMKDLKRERNTLKQALKEVENKVRLDQNWLLNKEAELQTLEKQLHDIEGRNQRWILLAGEDQERTAVNNEIGEVKSKIEELKSRIKEGEERLPQLREPIQALEKELYTNIPSQKEKDELKPKIAWEEKMIPGDERMIERQKATVKQTEADVKEMRNNPVIHTPLQELYVRARIDAHLEGKDSVDAWKQKLTQSLMNPENWPGGAEGGDSPKRGKPVEPIKV